MRRFLSILILAAALSSSAQSPAPVTVDTSAASGVITVTAPTVLTLTPGTYGNQVFTLTLCYDAKQYPVTYTSHNLRGTFDSGTLPDANDCQDFALNWVVAPARSYWLIVPAS